MWFLFYFSRLELITGMKLGPQIYKHFGVSIDSKKVKRGLVDTGDHSQLKEALVQLLREKGFHYEEAIITVNQVSLQRFFLQCYYYSCHFFFIAVCCVLLCIEEVYVIDVNEFVGIVKFFGPLLKSHSIWTPT